MIPEECPVFGLVESIDFKIALIFSECYAFQMKTHLYRPWIAMSALLVGLLSMVSCGSSTIPSAIQLASVSSDALASSVEEQVLEGINRFRRSQSKPAFRRSAELERLARHHAQEMMKAQKMSHDGFHLRMGAAETYYGIGQLRENIYRSKGFAKSQIPQSVVQGWIDSPGHRKNLLASNSVCGIGVTVGADGQVYAAQLSGSVINRGGAF